MRPCYTIRWLLLACMESGTGAYIRPRRGAIYYRPRVPGTGYGPGSYERSTRRNLATRVYLWGAICANTQSWFLTFMDRPLSYLVNKHLYLVNQKINLVNQNTNLVNQYYYLVNKLYSYLVNQRLYLVNLNMNLKLISSIFSKSGLVFIKSLALFNKCFGEQISARPLWISPHPAAIFSPVAGDKGHYDCAHA